ncbi:MAG: hypothetical protein KDJ74_15495 [Notoacmeibacter sp.]|nr:hypothetical protein [Notoacmeibacter sp.]MCC0026730.1 hypothetical protein [Brucellaceae bacterium]
MTRRDEKARKALATRPSDKDYEVGYAKPPVESQFKKGKSGNPKGRPRGSRNKAPALNEERLKAIIMEEAYRTIKINEGSKQIAIPMAKAVLRSLAHNAVKGNTRAQRLFSEMLASTEAANKRLHDEWLETAINYKIEWQNELERRRKLGTSAPDPVPHPDDIIVDVREGTVHINGPMTAEEKADYDWWRDRKAEWEDELPRLHADLETETDPRMRQFIQDEITHGENLLDKLRIVFPGRRQSR